MFIWDFVADTVLGQIIDWLYGQIVGFLGDFFMQMGSMGAELFEMSWVQSVVLLFYYLAWALYVTGIVVAAFECGIEYQNGRGSIRDTALNVIKGFLAASLFTTVPVELYKLSISLQGSFTAGITGLGEDIGTVAAGIVQSLQDAATWQEAAISGVFGGIGSISSPIFMIFLLILMGYAVIKVFFANLKRGGILLIQIAVGSLYLFSVPRGYIDGFVGWCKQVIGILLSIDMDNREIYVSTTGYAMKVLTDARVEKVLDAAYDSVADGNYAEGALGAIDSIENYLEMGVPAGQYTQVREEKKHSLEWYEVLFAAVAAAIVAALPCFSVMRQYKMQKEHRQSLGFHMAYRADSALHFVQNEEQFVNRSVVTRRIPKNPGPGASGGSAGRTTIHQGSSGRMHGGGGRKF